MLPSHYPSCCGARDRPAPRGTSRSLVTPLNARGQAKSGHTRAPTCDPWRPARWISRIAHHREPSGLEGAEDRPLPAAVRRQVAIATPIEDEIRLHGSAKLVVPLPAMTAPRANTWLAPFGM